MVSVMDEINKNDRCAVGFNQEFKKLELQYIMLKEQVANQLEMLANLREKVGPNIKADYMMKIGQFETRVYELKVEINRWKRRFTLRQQALNRGEKPDYLAIEAQLDKEFASYIEEIKKRVAEINQASLRFHCGKMTDQETAELRYMYLNAVKKLHPDLNPSLPESAVDLWNQIQLAYTNEDWDQFRFLCGLVDHVVSGERKFDASKDGIELLRESILKLRERSADIAAKTAELQSTVPFTYEVLLEDEDLVAARQQQLRDQIKSLEECMKEYEEMWNHGK